MNESGKSETTNCSSCAVEIKTIEAYEHRSAILCENCCLDKRTPGKRKTHWQNLKSIKTAYLRRGKIV